jgi:hypothetical protein
VRDNFDVSPAFALLRNDLDNAVRHGPVQDNRRLILGIVRRQIERTLYGFLEPAQNMSSRRFRVKQYSWYCWESMRQIEEGRAGVGRRLGEPPPRVHACR